MFQTNVEKIKTYTHFMFINFFFFFENLDIYEIMWKILYRPQMTIWRMRIACWIPKTNRLSDYVIFIAFPLQQWLHERAALLRCTYIACLITLRDGCLSCCYCSLSDLTLLLLVMNFSFWW